MLVSGRVYIFPRNLHSCFQAEAPRRSTQTSNIFLCPTSSSLRCRMALWFSIISSLAISTIFTSPICCICNLYVHMHIYIDVHISCRWLWNHVYCVYSISWEILEMSIRPACSSPTMLDHPEAMRSITSSASVSLRRPWLFMQLWWKMGGRSQKFFSFKVNDFMYYL